jgi:putative nucleotidyltransferase-like protein
MVHLARLPSPTPHMPRASVRDALQLRAWALQVLSGRADRTSFPEGSDATWDVFLRAERCALALKTRLVAAGSPVPHQVESAATRELQRILSARGQLQRIGQLVTAHDMEAVVLKGGVAALMSSAPVDLSDVDVLLRAPQAEQLAALLDAEGFRSTGPAGTAHLAQRLAPHTVQVEVHFALNEFEPDEGMWRRIRPVNGVAGLWRLGAADHLWQLLVHTVVIHAYRRGAMRDLSLIAQALGDCNPAELAAVEDRVRAHPLSQRLHDQLAMARELRDGLPVQDRFRREAAANYLLRGPLGWLGFSRFWTTAFLGALFAQLGSATERRFEWSMAWQRPTFTSPWRLAVRLERRWPRFGRWCRSMMKVARLIVVRTVAWPVAFIARQVANHRSPLNP